MLRNSKTWNAAEDFGCDFIKVTELREAGEDVPDSKTVSVLGKRENDWVATDRHGTIESLALSGIVNVGPKLQSPTVLRLSFCNCHAERVSAEG